MFYGNQELPQMIDADKVKKLILEYQKTGNIEARNIVIESSLRIVTKAVGSFSYYYDVEELVSVGTMGLIKCVDDYDISVGTKFSTVATKYVYTAIREFIQAQKKYTKMDSLDRIIFDSDRTLEENFQDTKIDIALDYEKKEQSIKIREIIENLPDNKRKIIELYFGFYNNLPLTEKEIAKKVGVTNSRVGQLKRRTLQILKPQFINRGIV